MKGSKPEVGLPFRAVDTIKEGRKFNELAAGVHEVQVENLLSCHELVWGGRPGQIRGEPDYSFLKSSCPFFFRSFSLSKEALAAAVLPELMAASMAATSLAKSAIWALNFSK